MCAWGPFVGGLARRCDAFMLDMAASMSMRRPVSRSPAIPGKTKGKERGIGGGGSPKVAGARLRLGVDGDSEAEWTEQKQNHGGGVRTDRSR